MNLGPQGRDLAAFRGSGRNPQQLTHRGFFVPGTRSTRPRNNDEIVNSIETSNLALQRPAARSSRPGSIAIRRFRFGSGGRGRRLAFRGAFHSSRRGEVGTNFPLSLKSGTGFGWPHDGLGRRRSMHICACCAGLRRLPQGDSRLGERFIWHALCLFRAAGDSESVLENQVQ